MNQAAEKALDLVCEAVRADLAAEKIKWHQAWFEFSKESDSSCATTIQFIERPGGPMLTTQKFPTAGDSVPGLPIDVPDANGRPWNQFKLTLHPDGRREVTFEYPGPLPEPDRRYSEQEILSNMAECVRLDLIFDQWIEASVEATPDLIPFFYRLEAPGEQLRHSYDCNGLDQWLKRLWDLRQESGQGPWGRVTLVFRRGDELVQSAYSPPERKVAEPPPLPRRKRSLEELFRRIVEAERAELDDISRRMEETGRVPTRWKRSRLTASRDENGYVIVDRLFELTHWGEIDEPVEDEVEDLFMEVYERVDAGKDPTRLSVPGLKVEPGESPRFTLVLRNDPPERGRR